MPQTLVRLYQIKNSDSYADNLNMSTAQSSAATVQDDLNFIRTQLKLLNGNASWFDAPSNYFNLKTIHDKKLIFYGKNLNSTLVPGGQNYILLSGIFKPTSPIAINADTDGAMVYQLPGSVGSNSTGSLPNGDNYVAIRDGFTNTCITTDEGYEVFGLLQVGSLAADGSSFSDSGNNKGQISFVYTDPNDLVVYACPTQYIQGQLITYYYKIRDYFYNITEFISLPSVTYNKSLQYGHVQSVPSAIWTITHNLRKFPSTYITDSSGNMVFGDIVFLDQNTISVNFSSPFSGIAYLN